MVLNRPNCFDSNPSLAGNRPKILVQDQKSQNITDFTHDHQKSQRSKYKTGFELASSRLNSTWQLTQNITSNSKVIEMQNFSLKNIKTPISLWNQVIETLKWTWIQNKMCDGHLQIRICWKWKATDEKKKIVSVIQLTEMNVLKRVSMVEYLVCWFIRQFVIHFFVPVH